MLLAGILILAILLFAAGIAVLRVARAGEADQEATAVAAATSAAIPSATFTPPATPTPIKPPPTVTTTALPPSPLPTITPAPTEPFVITHTVEAGQTLTTIADLYEGVTADEIAAWNGLTDPNAIIAGQVLIIPPREPVAPEPGTPAPTSVAPATFTPIAGEAGTAAATATSAVGADNKVQVGSSTFGHPIYDYVFGGGPLHVVFIGGIHGGYEWNTVALAYEAIDYFEANPDAVPEGITLHILPAMNPDGVFRVSSVLEGLTAAYVPDQTTEGTLEGRFNGREVDLNRNWGCNWSAEALWRNEPVSAGTEAFSEVENIIVRNYLLELDAAAAIFWHSASGIVAPGRCNDVEHAGSEELARVYAQAAGYAQQPFLAYDVTGDASDWLSSQGIPSVAVELTDHINTEWEKNLAGILAVLALYAAQAEGG